MVLAFGGVAGLVARHLLVLAVLSATAYVAGRLVGRLAGRRWIDADSGGSGLERFAVSIALGLALLAQILFALGSFGVLTRGPVLAVLVAVCLLGFRLLGLPVWRELVRGLRLPGLGWGLAAIAAAPMFVLGLYPPTGFDETMYHLPFARAFVRTGTLPFLPELRVPVFPQLDELLVSGLLMLSGDVSTHLLPLLATIATAALLIGWGGRAFSAGAGWLAAGLYLGGPIIVHLAGSGYVEPLLGLFVTASVWAVERWRDEATTDRGRWLALAGVFAGSAAGVKYLGLVILGVLGITILPKVIRERRSRGFREAAVAAAVALAVLAPTYGHIAALSGSPLFPFYPGLFGESPWSPEPGPHRTLAMRAADYAAFPWNVVLDRDAIGYQPPYSPAFLVGIPVLAFGFFRDRTVRRLLAVPLGFSLLLFVLPPDSRYMTIVLPVVGLALAGTLSRWNFPRCPRCPRWTLPALAVLAFLPGWAYGVYRIGKDGAVPATAADRSAYLARKLPAYAAVEFLNRRHGRGYTAYGFYTEDLIYHAEGTLLGDWYTPERYRRILPLMADAEIFRRSLRALDVDYLLLLRSREVRLPRGPEWGSRFGKVYSDRNADLYEVARQSP